MEGKGTFLSNDCTFVSPSTCFCLTSHILHVTHVLSYCLSPQIIANHHMQSISFASGGDPVSHSQLNPTPFFHLSSARISFLPVFCHCLFLWMLLPPLLSCYFPSLPFQPLASVMTYRQTQLWLNLFLLVLFKPFCPKTALQFVLPSNFFPLPGSPDCLTLSPLRTQLST